MMQLSLEEVRRGMGILPMCSTGSLPVRVPPVSAEVISAICTDSRLAKPGDLFVAIKGDKFDAHDFLPQVFQAGAAAAVVSRNAAIDPQVLRDFGGRLITVDDTVAALGRLGAYWRNRLKGKVIAVTGSNGKTTTKRMIEHILARHFRGTCSPKSFNNNIGVPLTLLGAAEDDDYVICEVGTNAPGEIDQLSAICRPDIAVITSVGQTHLEKLGSVELVAIEKASMLRHLQPGGCAIVWADSEPLAAALKAHSCRMIRFGASASADVRLTDFRGFGDHVEFRACGTEVRVPQPGMHSASNALAAMVAAAQMGLTHEQVAADLADFGGVAMRLETMQVGNVRVINDAYNANPSSMMAAADVLAVQEGGRRVLVAGDMLELGEATRQIHEKLGADIAAKYGRLAAGTGINLLIGIGGLGRYMASGARSQGLACHAFDTLEQAVAGIPSLLKDQDVVLIKGSRGAALERLIPPLRKSLEESGG